MSEGKMEHGRDILSASDQVELDEFLNSGLQVGEAKLIISISPSRIYWEGKDGNKLTEKNADMRRKQTLVERSGIVDAATQQLKAAVKKAGL